MKTAQIDRITRLGYDVIFNDVDVVWHRDVRLALAGYWLQRPDADVMFQQNWPQVSTFGCERGGKFRWRHCLQSTFPAHRQVEINPGFACYRASIQKRTSYFGLLKALEAYFGNSPLDAKGSHFSLGDQEATNSVLTCEVPGGLTSKKAHQKQRAYRKAQLLKHDLPKQGLGGWATQAAEMVRWYERRCDDGPWQNGINITFGILPPVLFQTGDVIYTKRVAGAAAAAVGSGRGVSLRDRGLITHANFIKGNERKLPFLMKLGLWCAGDSQPGDAPGSSEAVAVMDEGCRT